MTNPMIKIHNSETDEIITREMNAKEMAELKIEITAEATRQAEAQAIATAKAALLERLGITADEAALLLS